MWEWLKRLFGFGKQEPKRPRTPSPSAGTTSPGTGSGATIHPINGGTMPEPTQPIADPPKPPNIVGDPSLAKTVDLNKSMQWLLPDNRLNAPGDVITLKAHIVTVEDKPVVGLPVIWKVRATKKMIGGPIETNSNGDVETTYEVEEDDMIGDSSDDIPDSGSYLVDCYAGGRRLNKLTILYDVA